MASLTSSSSSWSLSLLLLSPTAAAAAAHLRQSSISSPLIIDRTILLLIVKTMPMNFDSFLVFGDEEQQHRRMPTVILVGRSISLLIHDDDVIKFVVSCVVLCRSDCLPVVVLQINNYSKNYNNNNANNGEINLPAKSLNVWVLFVNAFKVN